jgi:hypothetical protein
VLLSLDLLDKDMMRLHTNNLRHVRGRLARATICLSVAFGTAPSICTAEIIWSGDYETGNFLQWHRQDDDRTAMLSGVPHYGRPQRAEGESYNQPDSYYGDGSLLQIVTSPVRQGRYAAKFTVLNSQHGKEPDDCDAGETICTRRRTELLAHRTLPIYYNAIPYRSERWLSVSHYVPEDWQLAGSGFGIHVFQLKPLNDRLPGGGGLGPCFSIQLARQGWVINHRWHDIEGEQVPGPQRVEYSATYPALAGGDGAEELRADFPDQRVSQAALGGVNRGGWTDWVVHARFDARGAASGGQGFLTLWQRVDDGEWVQVLHLTPGKVTRNGHTYDRGICYNAPRKSSSNPGGFGIQAGMYMDKDQVWGLSRNRVIINDNIKVGSANATFADMSPDGSAPGAPRRQRPQPPKLFRP